MAEDTGGLTGSDKDVALESPKRQPHPAAPAVSDTNIDGVDADSGMGRGEEISEEAMGQMEATQATHQTRLDR
jgi:hypothetical protein